MLTAPSELLIRNQHLFQDKQLLLLNHEADRCAEQLASGCRSVTALALDFNHHQQLRGIPANVTAEFGHQLQDVNAKFDTVVIYYPKAKPLLQYLLTLAAFHLRPEGELIVVGENKGGIRSFNKLQSSFFSQPLKLDNARHCLLFSAICHAQPKSLDINAFVSRYTLTLGDSQVTICNMVGVFSEKQLDQGTELLLQHLTPLSGRVLDFGCGAGVIAVALLQHQPELALECVDINAMALLSCTLTLAANGMNAKVYPSDGLAQTNGQFNAIISNPPFHDGLMSTTDIATRFVQDSRQQLARNGVWQIVANRHLPYGDAIENAFGNVNVVAENNRYKVYQNKI
ncbi:methyltransferase [Shewanella avicenniae]|uniref:Ribosomal RNA small subunit methyltransferase C n=1 Tax=Shewanella avicenniae TaxID=2814294 RepID=A0ABX7QNR1_9GAMM|nr:methyltransferase [Shewanella avicenniae]QSX33107.1 methyltransferase [Shewanella avicenniae]